MPIINEITLTNEIREKIKKSARSKGGRSNWTQAQYEALSTLKTKPTIRPLADKIQNPKPEHNVEKAFQVLRARQDEGTQRFSLRIIRCSIRLLDLDNLYGGCKPLIDQLCEAGLIPDDDPNSIELKVEQIKVKTKKEEGTAVRIQKL